jgi:NUDIX domain
MNAVINKIRVALIAFRDGDKILLNRRADTNGTMWEFIGGGIEAGETPHEAIRREIAEEVNYTLSTDDSLQFVDELRITYGDAQAAVYCFTAQLPGLDKFSDSDEVFVRDLALFSRDEALELELLPMTRMILEDGIV